MLLTQSQNWVLRHLPMTLLVMLMLSPSHSSHAQDVEPSCAVAIGRTPKNTESADKHQLTEKKLLPDWADYRWQIDPEAFVKFFFRDFDKLPSSGTLNLNDVPKVRDLVKGKAVEWPVKYGRDPRHQKSTEPTDPGMPWLYDIVSTGKGAEKALVAILGSRGEGENEIDQDEMTWGIAPQDDVVVKGKLKEALVVIVVPKYRTGNSPPIWISTTLKSLRVQTASERCKWPEYHEQFRKPAFVLMGTGDLNLIVRNSFPFAVKVGVRRMLQGRDFIVPSNDTAGVFLPEGKKYDIYFQYANDFGSLYQGDSFDLEAGKKTTIQLKKQIGGNYNIRKVK